MHGNLNVRSKNQGKLEVVKQMARVNINILRISKLKWTGMGDLTQMTIIVTTVGRNPSEEMEEPLWSTKDSKMQYLDAVSKTTERSLFVSKANHSTSQLSKSMPQPVMLKKLKLNGSMKTYKTF